MTTPSAEYIRDLMQERCARFVDRMDVVDMPEGVAKVNGVIEYDDGMDIEFTLVPDWKPKQGLWERLRCAWRVLKG